MALPLAALLALATAHAETLYVVEQVVVNVNSAAGCAAASVSPPSRAAMRVELLERQGEQVHVRLADGTRRLDPRESTSRRR